MPHSASPIPVCWTAVWYADGPSAFKPSFWHSSHLLLAFQVFNIPDPCSTFLDALYQYNCQLVKWRINIIMWPHMIVPIFLYRCHLLRVYITFVKLKLHVTDFINCIYIYWSAVKTSVSAENELVSTILRIHQVVMLKYLKDSWCLLLRQSVFLQNVRNIFIDMILSLVLLVAAFYYFWFLIQCAVELSELLFILTFPFPCNLLLFPKLPKFWFLWCICKSIMVVVLVM